MFLESGTGEETGASPEKLFPIPIPHHIELLRAEAQRPPDKNQTRNKLEIERSPTTLIDSSAGSKLVATWRFEYRSNQMNTNNEPKLAPPGAGLPMLEHFLARYWVMPKLYRKMSWDDADAFFARESAKVISLVENLDEARATKRVLIDHIKGLEDSSRYWSVQMTLEHMMIVGRPFAQLVSDLSEGKQPQIKLSIAQAKPKGGKAFKATLAEFREFTFQTLNQFKSIQDPEARASKTQFPHPWFGPLTCAQWHIILGTHQGIHRRQIAAILVSA